MGPAGTVHCSVPDWAKFAALHLDGKQGKSKLLKPSTIRALHTPPPGRNYAGGWIVVERSWASGLALNHNGSATPVGTSSIWLAPVLNFAILVATNQGGKPAETACDEAVSELIKALPYLTLPSDGEDCELEAGFSFSRSIWVQAGSPLTGLDRATCPPGNRTE